MKEFFHTAFGKWILRGVGLLFAGALTAVGKDLYDTSKAKYHAHVIAEAQESKLNKDSNAMLLSYLLVHARAEDSMHEAWHQKHTKVAVHAVAPKNFYDYKRAMKLMQQ